MDLNSQLTQLLSKPITIWVIGVGAEYSGTLSAIGSDYVDLDQGSGLPHFLIPIAAIACVSHRV